MRRPKKACFIDPADNATGGYIAEAKSHGLNKIKYIVNTHSHVDHIMGNAEMVKKTGAKIIIHEEDAAGTRPNPFLPSGNVRRHSLSSCRYRGQRRRCHSGRPVSS